jgi:hypothetical protein
VALRCRKVFCEPGAGPHIELFVQSHYRQSIATGADITELFRDVFLFHWKDECQHVILDELQLRRHDAALTRGQRDDGVDEFIALVAAADGILQMQARADAEYFGTNCGRRIPEQQAGALGGWFLKAYRWQYIFSGASHPRFQAILSSLITPVQGRRVEEALATLR